MSNNSSVVWYRDPKKLGLVGQAGVGVAVVFVIYSMISNASVNMEARGMHMNTWFMFSESPFKVGFSPFWEFELGTSKYWEVFVIGIQNTLVVSVAGLVGATVIGFTVGIARLSDNWFVRLFSAMFVEVFRNVPLLLQVFFWNFVVILSVLPVARNSISIADAVFLNKTGFYVPAVSFTSTIGVLLFLGTLAVGLFAISFFRRWSQNRFHETGKSLPEIWIALAIAIAFLTLAFLVAAGGTEVDYPEASRFGFKGGFQLPIPLFSLWVALVCYTGAFIAENVRAGIQSVSKGQREAAMALGFHTPLSMKLIQIPQAMRVIIPPTISQYLNLVKNSSLAVAIGYDDLVNLWMGITLNQTGQAIVIIAMTMCVYTTISLLTSLTLNIYNRRTQLVER